MWPPAVWRRPALPARWAHPFRIGLHGIETTRVSNYDGRGLLGWASKKKKKKKKLPTSCPTSATDTSSSLLGDDYDTCCVQR